MDVRIDEPRKRVPARGVEHLAVLRGGERSRGTQLGDVPVADQDVARLVELGAGIEDVGAAAISRKLLF